MVSMYVFYGMMSLSGFAGIYGVYVVIDVLLRKIIFKRIYREYRSK